MGIGERDELELYAYPYCGFQSEFVVSFRPRLSAN